MKHDVRLTARGGRVIGAVVLAALTASAIAQTAPTPAPAPAGGSGQTVSDQSVPDNTGLNLPTNLQIFGKVDPNVRKPTAIVNDSVMKY